MNHKKEKLKIGFVGSVNAMPMMIALKFKEYGYDVKYIVDYSNECKLHRPECHLPNISYPYPDWIIENVLSKYQRYLIPLAPKFFLKNVITELNDRDVIFFNDYGFQVSKYFSKDKIKIALFSGSDLADHADKKLSILCVEKKRGEKIFLFFYSLYAGV